MQCLSSIILSLLLLMIWSCSDIGDPVSCSTGLGCDGVCGSNEGPGTSGYLDVCGECGGLGYNAGGCCGDNPDCLSYSDIYSIFNTSYNFSQKCTDCHGSSGSLNLSSYANLMSGGSRGPVVIPLDSENSNLILKLNSFPSFGNQMPPDGPFLDATLIAQIAIWIDQGALESPDNTQ